ncbi:MAG: hybrid sensor histidine kinase/response regulator [Anaerolineae bacterium]|nr:hybrid sensor histidine kinase/response regulator [Anaerolineae bacterium]
MKDIKATILYIEDDPSSQRLVQRTLQFADYRVLVASRGIEGIDLARGERPDLILMDINLPDLSGREVTTRLRALPGFDEVPIVALTAQSHTGEREKALVAGANGYLTKPIDIDKLPAQVAGFLSGQFETLTPEVAQEFGAVYHQELVARLESKIRELEQVNSDLRRLDRAKEKFIQLTAHELRTPLTVIQGYEQLLRDSGAVDRIAETYPDVASIMQGLTQSIERMGAVISELVMVSRFMADRVELSVGPIGLDEILEKAISQYAQACRDRTITVVRPCLEQRITLRVDGALLAMAVSGILSNAIKYTPNGGTVTFMVQDMDDQIQLAVHDTGIGIDPEEQTRIFERFYTAGDTQLHSTSKTAFRGGGLGVGLSIARSVVEQHGGKIWVESAGRDEETLPGSTFFLRLPKVCTTTSAPLVKAKNAWIKQ